MQLHVDDAGFVRAPVDLVYRRITDLGGWPDWWPGAVLRPLVPGPEDDQVWALELRGAPLRRLRLRINAHGWRFHAGFSLGLGGDLDGRWEIWLEPSHGGTVVHHVVVATAVAPRPLRQLADLRRAIRAGLWGLKDTLQLEARTSAGLFP
jgi:hypothetical protein